MCYNLSVRKLIALITTLAVSATLGGAAAVYAEESTTDGLKYPDLVSQLGEDIKVSSYAVYGDTFALASTYTLYIYTGGTQAASNGGYKYSGGTLESYSSYFAITDLSYDNDGTLHLYDGTYTYTYSDGSVTQDSADFSKLFKYANVYTSGDDDFIIFTVKNNVLYVINPGSSNSEEKKFNGESYSMLKQADDGTIYVIKGGKLCIVEGSTSTDATVKELTFEYTDLSYGEKIEIGDCAELLQTTYSDKYVIVPKEQYVTRIDLSDLSGTYFKTVTEDGVHTYKLESNMKAVLLCTSGNAMIVASGGEAYITTSVNTTYSLTETEASFTDGQIVMEVGLYSSPYISEGTKIATLAEGTTVSVSYKLSAEIDGEQILETDFYCVSYTNGNGKTLTGYVATGFLSEYVYVTPSDDDLTNEWNSDYSEENVVFTVALVLVIVVLVIGGVVYIAYFSGSNRRNKKKPNADDEYGDSDHGGYGGYGGYGRRNGRYDDYDE